MDVLQPSVNWEQSSLADEWDHFQEPAQLMFAGKTEKDLCVHQLVWAGAKWCTIFNTFTIADKEQNKIEWYLEKFKEYTSPQKKTVFAQYLFQKQDQAQGESIEKYITDIKTCLYCHHETMSLLWLKQNGTKLNSVQNTKPKRKQEALGWVWWTYVWKSNHYSQSPKSDPGTA